MSNLAQIPLSNEQLRSVSPSVFAERPYHEVSSRYAFIPTIQVVDALRNVGWFPVKAREQRVNLEDKRGFTRHIVRLRRSDVAPVVGDVFPEIVLLNSHDATSAYQMHAGMFRLVCSNGLVVDNGGFERITVRHSGDVIGRVLEGSARIVEELPRLTNSVQEMRAVTLSHGEQELLANAALSMRYDLETAPIQASSLLRIRRAADGGADLWSTFNRVQENLLRGGVRGWASTGRRFSTRAVTSISEDTRLNKALWALAEGMRQLKTAA